MSVQIKFNKVIYICCAGSILPGNIGGSKPKVATPEVVAIIRLVYISILSKLVRAMIA